MAAWTSAMTKKKGPYNPEQIISRDGLRQVLLGLVDTEQQRLIANGAVAQDKRLANFRLSLSDDAIDDLLIDEDGLGFDSLSRLDLVLRVNQFFQLHTSGVEDYLLVKRRIGDWVDLVMHHLRQRGAESQIAFQTSGSTGPAKTVVHNLQTLRAEVDALLTGKVVRLCKDARIIALVPPQHIYGFLWTYLLPAVAGVETLSLHQQLPTRSFALAREGDVIVATPYIWQKLVHSGMHFSAGVRGVTSGAPADSTTWSAVEGAGLSDLVEIYGATETGGIGYRHTFDEPFQLMPHLERTSEGLRRIAPDGSLLDVQDQIVWSGSDRFEVVGRHDGAVQIAGVNVSPRHVAGVISDVSGVRSADVRFDGERLIAFVVPHERSTITDTIKQKVQRHLVDHLPPPARPASITFGDTLPRNEMGKHQMWE